MDQHLPKFVYRLCCILYFVSQLSILQIVGLYELWEIMITNEFFLSKLSFCSFSLTISVLLVTATMLKNVLT